LSRRWAGGLPPPPPPSRCLPRSVSPWLCTEARDADAGGRDDRGSRFGHALFRAAGGDGFEPRVPFVCGWWWEVWQLLCVCVCVCARACTCEVYRRARRHRHTHTDTAARKDAHNRPPSHTEPGAHRKSLPQQRSPPCQIAGTTLAEGEHAGAGREETHTAHTSGRCTNTHHSSRCPLPRRPVPSPPALSHTLDQTPLPSPPPEPLNP